MFGYVTTNMEEMKIKDYRIYHGFYCGVCQDLKEGHGQTSRVTLTYDVTFLGILLTGDVYKRQFRIRSTRYMWIPIQCVEIK